jgi:hypothetical protein
MLWVTTPLLACAEPAKEQAPGIAREQAPGIRKESVTAADSLVLTSPGGAQVWFTLSRNAMGAGGQACVERGLEIRDRGKRVKVPLLYTGGLPVLLNDSTIRAVLWNHCQPGDTYLVNLRSGQPTRHQQKRAS